MVVYKDDKFSSDSLIESNRSGESENTKNANLGESGLCYSNIIISFFFLFSMATQLLTCFRNHAKCRKRKST